MKIAVLGAGVSGIIFAINRKQVSPKDEIIVFEHLDKPLKKILATGNGKCNIGNRLEIYQNLNEPIAKNILIEYNYEYQKEFLNSLNIKTKLVNDLSYPISESAITVRNALIKASEKAGVKIQLGTTILDYRIKGNSIRVTTNRGEEDFDKLIFAVGGKSSPNLGSDGSVLPLLEKHGYKIKEFVPALCPIYTKEQTKELDGVRVKANVKVLENNKAIFDESGELLFKKHGLSGIVIFNASRYLKSGNLVKVDLLPGTKEEELNIFLKENGQQSLLESYLHPLLAKYILKQSIKDKDIVKYIKGMIFTFDKTYDFDNSQISKGGILFNDIDENLQSKSERGIYFLGELLDYDAPCGGYNLMWAIATGLYLSKII